MMSAHPPVEPRRRRWALFLVIAVVLVGVGASVGLLIAPVRPPDDLAPGVDPSSAPAAVQQFEDSRAVTLTYQTGPDIPLVTHVDGVVTRAPDGLTVVSGKPVLSVGGLAVIGLATATPLYRDLTLGDDGTDVQAFNAELARLGHKAPASARFTGATLTAWLALQKACGVSSPNEDVSLGAVVWLPAQSVQVRAWTVALGSPTPTDGILGVVAGAVDSAKVTLSDGRQLPADERSLTVNGVTIELPADATVVDKDFLAGTLSSTQLVSVDGVTFVRQAQGTIQLVTPLTVVAVPPTAVFAIDGSSGCLEVAGVGVPVTIVGSSLGVSLVTTSDGSVPTQVGIGAGITVTGCS